MVRSQCRRCISHIGAALIFALGCGAADARSGFHVLYAFKGGSDGATPEAGLLFDHAGNLYGTTYNGGTYNHGTVFELSPDGTEKVLHAFDWNDGAYPQASLVMDGNGNLFGTSVYGGGAGNIFELTPDGTESVLYEFMGGDDGGYPASGLLADKAGNLYGTNPGFYCDTSCGSVYKLAPDGTLTVLHSFSYTGKGGAIAFAVPVADKKGNLYGTASNGGAGSCACGVVYAISPSGKEKVLHTFAGGTNDGSVPLAGVIADSSGNLYGTTSSGGAADMGTVFELAPDETFTLLHSFSGSDGNYPAAALVADASGNLYGTTMNGDSRNLGVVFKLSPDGTETILHAFKGRKDGANPVANLIIDKKGNLFGTATSGGAYGNGVVFEIGK